MSVKPAASPATPPAPPPTSQQAGATPAPVSPPVQDKAAPRPDSVLPSRPFAFMPLVDLSGMTGRAAHAGPLPSSGDPFAGAVQQHGDAPQPSVYRAHRGDTFRSVAEKLGVPLHDLQAANPGVKKIRAGQLLQVPPPAPATPPISPEIKQHIEERLAGWPAGAPERAELVRDFASPAFAKLNVDEQRRLVSYVSGQNPISTSGREQLTRLLSQPGASPDQLRSLVSSQPGLPNVVAALPEIAEPARRPYTINGPTQADNQFASGAAPSSRYDVEIDGQTIPVFVSQSVEPNDGTMHSLEEVVRGLAALPDSSRRLIRQVNVDGKRNPSDSYWEKVYNQPGFRSYMTAGASGVVDIYPTTYKQNQHACDASLIHETGHILSGRLLGNWQNDPRWQSWDAATAFDGLAPSTYSRSSRTEDFSEALTLYQLSRGTPYEAEYRAMFPARFAGLDAVLAAPPPVQ